jgi:hypothetical protein
MSVAGGCAWLFVVGRVEQIRWKSDDTLPLTDVPEAV